MESEFQPFKLELTVSTLDQARALYAIFNHTGNSGLLSDTHMITGALLKQVGDRVYVSDRNQIISNGVTYSEFYK